MKRGCGTKGFEIIRTYDPALDFESCPPDVMQEFLSTREVELIKPYLVGDAVVYFARHLSDSECRSIDGLHGLAKYERAFSLAITRVENHFTDDGSSDGRRQQWLRPSDGKTPRPLGDSHLAMFSVNDRKHVGQVIADFSFCAPDSLPYVPLLDTCRDATTAAELRCRRLRAAQTKPSSASPPGSRNQPAVEQDAPTP